MAYASQEARQDLLASIAEAIDEVGRAMAALGDAYDQLDEHTADVLEEQLFRPAQAAYARAQRTYSGFAERHGLDMLTPMLTISRRLRCTACGERKAGCRPAPPNSHVQGGAR